MSRGHAVGGREGEAQERTRRQACVGNQNGELPKEPGRAGRGARGFRAVRRPGRHFPRGRGGC